MSFSRGANRELARLKGKHAGNEVFIIGSGPSISQTDLSKLDGAPVIFLNKALKLSSEFSPSCKYLAISDHLRALELRREINFSNEKELTVFATTDKLFNSSVDPSLFASPFIFVEPKLLRNPKGTLQIARSLGFSDNLYRGVYLGKSVVFPAIQFAYHLGAKAITLLGVDMTIGKNAAHFDKTIKSYWDQFDYARDGREHFMKMQQALRARGVALNNATVGGVLDALPHTPTRFAFLD